MNIEQRVALQIAVQRHLRAVEKFETANEELMQASQAVRDSVPFNARLVANVNHKLYMLTSDEQKNFNIEPIESL
jgi:hypothetical protein